MANNSLSARVVKALTLFGGVKIIDILCAVVRNKLLAVLVGPAGVGLNAIFNRSLDVVASATQLNLRQSSVRDISAASDAERPSITTAVGWWALRLGIIGALVMLAFSPGFAWFSYDSFDTWWLFALIAIPVLIQSVINGDLAVMQGTDRLKVLAKSQIWTALCSMIGSVACYWAFGVNGVVPAIVISYVLSLIVTRWCRGKSTDIPQPARRSIEIGKHFLGLGLSMAVATVITTAGSYIFIAWLTRHSGENITGIFQAGSMLIVNYAGMVFTAISMEFYPRLVKVISNAKHASTILSHEISTILIVLIPVVAFFIPAAPLMIKILYSGKFVMAIPMVTIGICGTAFRAVSFCMAFVIIAKGDGKMFIITETISTVIGLALNISMYLAWGFEGLGISYVVWYTLYMFIVAAVCRMRYGVNLHTNTAWLAIGAFLLSAMSFALNLLGWWAAIFLATVCTAVSAQQLVKIFLSRQ